MKIPPLDLGLATLRHVTLEDAASVAEMGDNPKIWRFSRNDFPSPFTLEEAQFLIEFSGRRGGPFHYAIVVDERAVGIISYTPQSDVYKNNVEVGYWIGEPYWGRGIMTKVLDTFSQEIFSQLNVLRIQANTFGSNLASHRVLEKAGYVREAVFRKRLFKLGQCEDEWVYARLKG